MLNIKFQEKKPPLYPAKRECLKNLKSHVAFLASDSRGRNFHLGNSLAPSRDYIIDQFRSYGYQVSLQEYQPFVELYSQIGAELLAMSKNLDETYANIKVELPGKDKPDDFSEKLWLSQTKVKVWTPKYLSVQIVGIGNWELGARQKFF
jgi:hypothetical protein